jgi:hypothetical protein
MSRRRQEYKRHVVEVTTLQINDKEGGYTVHFDIEDHTDKKRVDVTHFETGQRFKTDEEALTAGIELGQRKVDIGYEVRTPVLNNTK